MKENPIIKPRITRHEAILLGSQDQNDQNGEDRVWRISDGDNEIACIIPSANLRDTLLAEPLTSYRMQLVDWDAKYGASPDILPVLTAVEFSDELDDPLRLLPPSLCPVDGVVENTLELLDQLECRPLRCLVRTVFRRREVASAYWVIPASRRHHHARPGGLAVHSLEVARDLAGQQTLARHERELCIAAGLLHDIGKIWAYTADMFLSAPAKAMGHELLGLSRLEQELTLLEQDWPDGAYALRVMLSGNSRMRTDGSMPSSLLARLKAADQRSCEQDRALRNEEGAWTPVTYLPTKMSSFDQWVDDLIEI